MRVKAGAPPASPPPASPPAQAPRTRSSPERTTPGPSPTPPPAPSPSLSAQVNSALLVFGDSGTGKSTLIATYANYIWKMFRKVTRLYSMDGGGYGNRVQALIDLGIIWVWRLRTRDPDNSDNLAMETCLRASQGYWPAEIKDTANGIVPQGVKLLAPITSIYRMYCTRGHLVREVPTHGQLKGDFKCPECPASVSIETAKVETESFTTPGLEQCGGAAFDGITSMGDWSMQDMAEQGALGRMKVGVPERVESGGIIIGANNETHYGFAQLQCEKYILNSSAIPGLVRPPMWTALKRRAADRESSMVIYGPDIPGKAKISKVPQWVGDCLGTTTVTTEAGTQFRLYLKRYADPGEPDVPNLCKVRIDPGFIREEYLADPAGSDELEKFNIGYFFQILDDAREQSKNRLSEEFPDAPGLPSGRIGGPRIDQPTPTPAVQAAKVEGDVRPKPSGRRPRAAKAGAPESGPATSATAQSASGPTARSADAQQAGGQARPAPPPAPQGDGDGKADSPTDMGQHAPPRAPAPAAPRPRARR